MKMRQVIVGTYCCGHAQAQLVLREGDGAEFYLVPEDGCVPRIKLGADRTSWSKMVSVLLHEIQELIMEQRHYRYTAAGDRAQDHGSYVFMLNHAQFSDLCACAGEYLTAALPDLATAWKKWRK